MDKELKRLVDAAARQGWTVRLTTSGHYKFFPPDGSAIVVVSGTSHGGRGRANAAAQLRRAGLVL